ncbi:MAG: acyl-CoA dehydrogenase [bacterium]|nr:acyl-CoA dehydrogenase [bacterium]
MQNLDFLLPEEVLMMREMVADFAQNELAPHVIEYDETQKFPLEQVKKMGELGLMGIPYPEEYDGANLGYLGYAVAIEEIAKVDGSTALTLAAHTSLGLGPIYLFGSDEQKKKYMPPMCRGDVIGAFGLTEPEAGSDAGGTQTTAVRENGSWVLNGQKIYITNSNYADTFVATAMTDRSKKTKGISSFIIEKGTPGFSIGKKENKMGCRASDTATLHFDNCKIPAENILGKEGEGFKQFLHVLDGGRISIGAMALGLAEGAFLASAKYAQERKQFNQPIAEFQSTQMKLATMATEIEAARHLIYHAAKLKDAGRDYIKESSMAKLYASEVATRTCLTAIQIHGGYGYIKEYHVERMMRDAKLCEIGEGTSEIQRLIISREILQKGNLLA